MYKKLNEMLKPINIQLKFMKDDKIFCHFKPSQLNGQNYLSIKYLT